MAAVAVLGVLAAGCGSGSVSSELVMQWSGEGERPELAELRVPDTVIETDVERAVFLRGLPEGLPIEDVEAADLDRVVLVAGGYHRCTESSYVEETPSDGLAFAVARETTT